jgi:hypothetical protein
MFHSVVPWELQAKTETILDDAEKSKKQNPFFSIYINLRLAILSSYRSYYC